MCKLGAGGKDYRARGKIGLILPLLFLLGINNILGFKYPSPPPPQWLGVRIGSLLEGTISLIFALVIAFAYAWLTTFVILVFLPVQIIGGVLFFVASSGGQSKSHREVSSSTEVKNL